MIDTACVVMYLDTDMRSVCTRGDIDTISIFLTDNIGLLISISFTATLFGLLIYFIIASKVVVT